MMDLARKGFRVEDVQRVSKSMVIDIKTLIEMANMITTIVNEVKDMASMSNEGLLKHYTGVSDILKDVNKTRDSASGLMANSDAANRAWVDNFKKVDDFKHDGHNPISNMKKEKELLTTLEVTYKDSMNIAKEIGNQEKEIVLLEDALKKLDGVSGAKESEQIQAQIRSISATLKIKKNLLLSNLAALEAIDGKIKLDQIAKDRENNWYGGFGVSDPYHPDELDKKTYSRPKSKGMIDF